MPWTLLGVVALLWVAATLIWLLLLETKHQRSRKQQAALQAEQERIRQSALHARRQAHRIYVDTHRQMVDAARRDGVRRIIEERRQQ